MSIKVYVRTSAEHEVLWENIERLQAFRDGKQPSDVSDYQWKLLKKQLKAMRKYNKILARRVEDLYETNYDELNNASQTNYVTTPGQPTNIGDMNIQLQSDENFMQDEVESIKFDDKTGAMQEIRGKKATMVIIDDNITHLNKNNKNFNGNTH